MTPRLFALLAAWLIGLALVTLRAGIAVAPLPWHSLGGGGLAGVDAIANLILFAPAGWILSRGGVKLSGSLLLAFLLSAGVEVIQLWVPGRTSIIGDVLLNVIGAGIGWRVGRPVAHESWRRSAVHVVVGTLLALQVADHTWWIEPGTVTVTASSEWRRTETRAVVDCGVVAIPRAICHTGPAADHPLKARLVSGERLVAELSWEPAAADDEAGRGCVRVRYRTILAPLRLRPPTARYCDLSQGSEVTVPLHPMLQRHLVHADSTQRSWEWRLASVSTFLWPVWPWPGYRPTLLMAVGVAVFYALFAALGLVPLSTDALGYLLLLASAAGLGGLRGPGLFEVACMAVPLVGVRLWRAYGRGIGRS